MTVEKRGDEWCVLHGHPQKTGSKTDKPAGTPIHCYSIAEFGEEGARKKAMAMHYAIQMSEARGDSKCIMVDIDSNGESHIHIIELDKNICEGCEYSKESSTGFICEYKSDEPFGCIKVKKQKYK